MAQLPPHPSIVLVREFLDAIDKLDPGAARRYVAPDARFVTPGGTETGSLDEIVMRLGQRFRQIGKKIERYDRVEMHDGDVVFVSGSLHGAWEDGAPFDNLRFVDRFEIRGGKIVLHEVWNDTGEARAKRAAAAAPGGRARQCRSRVVGDGVGGRAAARALVQSRTLARGQGPRLGRRIGSARARRFRNRAR